MRAWMTAEASTIETPVLAIANAIPNYYFVACGKAERQILLGYWAIGLLG